MALLEVSDVSVRFGGVQALSAVDLGVEEGSIHCIIGPNGAGKSTLVNVLTGRLRPDQGDVVFGGESLIGAKPFRIQQQGIARVFQSPAIFPELTLVDNVAVARLAKRDGSFALNAWRSRESMQPVLEEAEQSLERVGLADQHETEARFLSRGDKRRLELAVCLASEPRLLLLDEPTAGMSHHETHATIELLKRDFLAGVTQVVIEHDMHLVFALADRLSVLHQGEVIAHGRPDEVRGQPQVVEAYLGGAHQ